MIDAWREWLYPLGFLSAIAFGGRMLLQWIGSEAKGKSLVTPLFWRLSLAGNIMLALHSFIQIQFHVCIIQTCNAVISWRNLNLMQPASCHYSTKTTIQLMLAMVILSLLAFEVQDHLFLQGSMDWFRIPVTPWENQHYTQIPFSWHLLGFVGMILFSSRFWLQWWCVEKKQTSYLGPLFWWVSLIGDGICLTYFLYIHDPVNFIGPAFAIIPYIRNLMLINRSSKESTI